MCRAVRGCARVATAVAASHGTMCGMSNETVPVHPVKDPALGGFYVTMVNYWVGKDSTPSWEAVLMRNGHVVTDVRRFGTRPLSTGLLTGAETAELDAQAQVWGGDRTAFVTHLVDLVNDPVENGDEDLGPLRIFLADRLDDDLQIAIAAGHGTHIELHRDERRQPSWTRLDEDANVRLVYDVRFLERWNPEVMHDQVALKAQLALDGDVATLLALVQEWGRHPKFDPSWARNRSVSRPDQTLALLRVQY